MPTVTVRNYRPQVETQALPSARLSAAPTAESMGAGLADNVNRAATSIYQQEVAQQDQIAVLEADRKVSEWENKRLYDPKEGALNRRGKDAFGLPDEVNQEFDTHIGEVRKSLANDRQRMAFDRQVATRRKDIESTLTRHVFAEVRKHDDNETENYLLNARQAAVANAGDPDRVVTEIERQQAAVIDYAKRNGLGAEYVKQKVTQVRSDTHVGVVERMLANGQDMAAKQYVDRVKGEIAGDDVAKVEKWLEEGTLRGESQRQSDAILSDATSREEAISAARNITDPKLRDAVEERVNKYWTLKKQADAEAREQSMIQAANIIEQTGSVDRIPPAQWASFTPSERSALKSYANNGGKHDEGRYYELVTLASSPETQEEFLKRNLMLDAPKLGKSELRHLMNVQASLRAKDTTKADKLLASERVQNQIINDAILSMGLDPTPNEKTSEGKRNQVLAFRQAVRTAVAGHEQRTGKNATDADVQTIVDNLIVKGKVPGTGWFVDDTKRAFELTDGEVLVIKPADVPRAERKKIEDFLKRNNRAVTDDAVVTLYTEKLKRLRDGRLQRTSVVGGE